jgi:hypothetical protein
MLFGLKNLKFLPLLWGVFLIIFVNVFVVKYKKTSSSGVASGSHKAQAQLHSQI